MLQAIKAEVVSNSRNKIHQTWGPPFSRALYSLNKLFCHQTSRGKSNLKVTFFDINWFNSFHLSSRLVTLTVESSKSPPAAPVTPKTTIASAADSGADSGGDDVELKGQVVQFKFKLKFISYNWLIQAETCAYRQSLRGCENMTWNNCVFFPAEGKQNVTFSPDFTQPGKSL